MGPSKGRVPQPWANCSTRPERPVKVCATEFPDPYASQVCYSMIAYTSKPATSTSGNPDVTSRPCSPVAAVPFGCFGRTGGVAHAFIPSGRIAVMATLSVGRHSLGNALGGGRRVSRTLTVRTHRALCLHAHTAQTKNRKQNGTHTTSLLPIRDAPDVRKMKPRTGQQITGGSQ
jgi:hypothetical protein